MFTPVTLDIGVEPIRSLAPADFDGDGLTDLALIAGASVLVLVNDGGALTGGPIIPVGDVPAALGAADLDGDGRIDLAVGSYKSNDVTVLRNIAP